MAIKKCPLLDEMCFAWFEVVEGFTLTNEATSMWRPPAKVETPSRAPRGDDPTIRRSECATHDVNQRCAGADFGDPRTAADSVRWPMRGSARDTGDTGAWCLSSASVTSVVWQEFRGRRISPWRQATFTYELDSYREPDGQYGQFGVPFCW